jgi:hypothetical protein
MDEKYISKEILFFFLTLFLNLVAFEGRKITCTCFNVKPHLMIRKEFENYY